jgi:hypothetical protein
MSDPIDFTKIEDLIIKETGIKDDMMDAMTHAMLYGSASYTVGMDKGRGHSKSVVNILKGRNVGTIGHIATGNWIEKAWINDYFNREWPDRIMHVFHHTKGYMVIKGYSHHLLPPHCYALIDKQWYQTKGKGRGQPRRIKVSKVPAEHRLFLMVNHIDQPKE